MATIAFHGMAHIVMPFFSSAGRVVIGWAKNRMLKMEEQMTRAQPLVAEVFEAQLCSAHWQEVEPFLLHLQFQLISEILLLKA